VICSEQDDVGFVLIGDGPMEQTLRQRAADNGLAGRLVFAGFRKDVDQLVPHAACLVQSSLTEGMPNVVLEAMAAGVPVVATAVGGTPELVEDRKTGVLVPPGDARPITKWLRKVLADRELAAAMGAAGRQRVKAHFTFASQAADYVDLVERLAIRSAQHVEQAVAGGLQVQ
jgi:glycosyltransferase involved in cell wall biosynthesis